MKLKEVMKQLEDLHAKLGPDAEFVLYEKDTEKTYTTDPDADVFEFEFCRGDNEVVVEFGHFV